MVDSAGQQTSALRSNQPRSRNPVRIGRPGRPTYRSDMRITKGCQANIDSPCKPEAQAKEITGDSSIAIKAPSPALQASIPASKVVIG